jgi:cytochrome c oxidase subunit 4
MVEDDKKAKRSPGADEDLDDEWEDDRDDDESDDDDFRDEHERRNATTRPATPDRASAATRAARAAAEAHDHGLAHLTPVRLLVAVFAALAALTVATVLVTSFDLGSQGNFIIAMVIATVKAGLVMAFFMHLVWDKKFNLTVFLSAFLFVLLFLGLTLTDRNEYQTEIDLFEAAAAPAAPAASAGP